MTEPVHDQDAPPATIAPLRRISPLWLIPIVAFAVGAWMVYDNWASQGPLITIEFATAEGLEAGKTKVKTRDVEVGQVEAITLNDELDGVIVTARINLEFRDLLRQGSRFWVVQPTIGLSGVSGLGTILTGQYIRFSPSREGRRTSRFRGLDAPPLTPLGTPGVHVVLTTEGEFSFAKGDQIHYQGITVGKIEDLTFDFDEGRIYYSAFIEAPYHRLVTANTRFWRSSGIRAEISTDGIAVETGPLSALVQGGISFSVLAGQAPDQLAEEGTRFYIYPNRAAIFEPHYLHSIKYWVLVRDSVGGLNVGAPVMYRGLQVGQVLRTDYLPPGTNLLDRSLAIPVLIEIHPGRLGLPDSEAGIERATADINAWIRQGLTATIRSQNFLLGQQLVDLAYDETASNSELAMFEDLAVIPTRQDTFEKFTHSIEELLARLNQLPVEAVTERLGTLIDDAGATLASIRGLAESGEDLLGHQRNAELVAQMSRTLAAVESLAASFSGDSATNRDLQRALQSTATLLEELRPLVNELKNKPNSLIFSADPPEEAIPMRKRP